MRDSNPIKLLVPALLLAVRATTGAAQAPESAESPPAAATGKLVVGGVVGAAAGLVVGVAAGAELERSFFPCSCDDPGLGGAIAGAATPISAPGGSALSSTIFVPPT